MLDSGQKREVAIGILGAVMALVLLFIWIPSDVETGVIDVWRRTVRIGDAMLPTFAACGMLVVSIVIAVKNIFVKSRSSARTVDPHFAFSLCVILFISLALMQFTGPAAIRLWSGGEVQYRQVITTAPWKYLGFLTGGTLMVFGFITLSEHRVRWRSLVIAGISTLLIALLYDLPFDSLFLPPNGDF